jgi:hypothetical protein
VATVSEGENFRENFANFIATRLTFDFLQFWEEKERISDEFANCDDRCDENKRLHKGMAEDFAHLEGFKYFSDQRLCSTKSE